MLLSCLFLFATNLGPDLSADARAQALVGKMTTEEKIGQLMMDAPAIPRLGIPAYHWWNEALHGVARNGTATVFPQAIGLAATWNTPLVHQIATVISTEARAKNNLDPKGIYHGLTLWSPNVNIFRDPRWGRGHETYGEDPFLTGQMGVAFVTGIQGDDPKVLRAVATPKHFAVHSGPEPLRHQFDAKTPERDVFETYLPAFEATVRQGRAQSIMAAYSAFNGKPATGNPWLLTDLLRKTWGFNGAVVSDVDSVHDLWAGHHTAKDAAEASAQALKAGNDLCSGDTYRALPEALRRGLITGADLDRAATRLFTLRFRLGMFDKVPYQSIPASEIDSPAHDQLALRAARESLVLLKNDGTLPLRIGAIKRLAVIGPVADDQTTLLGNYNGTPTRPVTILAGLRQKLRPRGVSVDFAPGCALAAGLSARRDPFPAGSLFTGPDLTQPGLKREVFANRTLDGAPIFEAVDSQVDFAWNPPSTPLGGPTTEMSARWSGVFVPPISGAIRLGVSADDGVRLFVDDKLVIDDWRENAERSSWATINAKKGNAMRIRLEFFQAEQGAAIRFGWSNPGVTDGRLNEAIRVAKSADAVVLTLGITPDLEGEEMAVSAEGFSGGDRKSIALPAPQRELLAKISALGKPVIVVLTGGSSLSFDTSRAKAVLLQWYSGQRGGTAVAEALFGDVNPAGRLPVTFYKSENDLPAFTNYAMAGRTYRYFRKEPLFPFGFGLSYSQFAYGKPVIQASKVSKQLSLAVPIQNVGKRAGDEVVQIYARRAHPASGDPIRRLVGFARLSLKPGERQTAKFEIPVDRLRVWSPSDHRYIVPPDEYIFEFAASSADVRSVQTYTIR